MSVPETYRGNVTAAECDVFGHLNIAFYVERFGDAATDLLERLVPGSQWRTVGIATRYARELRAGDTMAIRSRVLRVADGAVHLGHEMVDGASGAASTQAEHRLVLDGAALDNGGPVEEQHLRATLAAAVAPWDQEAFPPVALPEGMGPIAAGRDRVKPWEAESSGRLALLGYLQRFSSACLQVLDAVGMTEPYRRAARRGYATFDTRLDITGEARVGEGVAIASAVLDAGTSSLRMLHRLSEAQTGRPIASFFQAGVHFDLDARRSAPLPPEVRDRARALRLDVRS